MRVGLFNTNTKYIIISRINEISEDICKKNLNIMNKNQTLLNRVHTPFKPLLEHVLESKAFGVECGRIELIKVASSHGDMRGDRFSITIPYAKQSLGWIVMFDAANPEIGPDFEFNDKTFLSNPNIEMLEEFVPSLMFWNYANKDCLLNVLTELVSCYKTHQKNNLNDQLNVQWLTLIEQTDICDKNMEVILLPDSCEPNEAHFLIKIFIDVSKLPKKYCLSDEIAAILHVAFHGARWNQIVPQIQFSSSLNVLLGNTSNLHIPPLSTSQLLMDYLNEIKKIIDDKVNAIVVNFEKRKNYINAIICMADRNITEYDASDFTYIVFMLCQRDFHAMVHINLPLGFPKDAPKITLLSIYNISSSTGDVVKSVLNIPYNAKLDQTEMVNRTLAYIAKREFDKFKISSTRHCR